MKRLTLISLLLSGLMLLASTVSVFAEKRGVAVMPQVAAGSVPIGGEYRALLIGIDQYQHVPKLQSAVRDTQAVREVLVQRYGFARDHVTELLDAQATREGIENAFYQLRKKAGPQDSVFIYYAGHGQIDQEDQMGYWVPVEGKAQSPGTFISNDRIRGEIAKMKAKHVYFVADSCFSGTLFASGRALPPLNDKFFARLYANKSRWGLTSGMNEPVTDAGKDGHSMFAYFLLKLLKENEDPYLVPSHIYDQIAPLIGCNTDQQPVSQPLQNAGDEGGQFVFRLVSASGGPLPSPPPRAGEGRPVLSPGEGVGGGSSAALTQAEQELKALEEQERQAEEQKKLAEIQKQIEEKKKKLEVASLPTPSLPRQTGREITGKDSAPMVLVPEGEFIMGSNDGDADEKPERRVTLEAFYMDKYEVSTRLYATFIQDTRRAQPSDWSQQVALVGSGDRPVVNVTWHDADAYCRHYGKRLPTEQEWEKAARGTDGQKYPWGNDEPSSRHALFNTKWNGYGTLATVESYEAGKSPYGLYHMAGNVWEWTSSDYDNSTKVLRGGSWVVPAGYVHSVFRLWAPPSVGGINGGFRCVQDAR